MILTQKVDLTILLAMEVSENEDIANWKILGKIIRGMGDAMDLIASTENSIVVIIHMNKAGKITNSNTCTLL
jgi:3-oxoacid CoA-transferase subunit B